MFVEASEVFPEFPFCFNSMDHSRIRGG
ncbi:MAG: hypothetical protein QOI13_1717, partial [Paraburkholderia sp.]|nr:hypothetical protein [Paraburkholderia sp.]